MKYLNLKLKCVDEIQVELVKNLLIDTLHINGFLDNKELFEIETSETLRVSPKELLTPGPTEFVLNSPIEYDLDKIDDAVDAVDALRHLPLTKGYVDLNDWLGQIMCGKRSPTVVNDALIEAFDPIYRADYGDEPESKGEHDESCPCVACKEYNESMQGKKTGIAAAIVASGPYALLLAEHDEKAKNIEYARKALAKAFLEYEETERNIKRVSKQIKQDKGCKAYQVAMERMGKGES